MCLKLYFLNLCSIEIEIAVLFHASINLYPLNERTYLIIIKKNQNEDDDANILRMQWMSERKNGHKVRIILVFNSLSKMCWNDYCLPYYASLKTKEKKNGSGCCSPSTMMMMLLSLQLLLNSPFAWSTIIWSRNNKKPHYYYYYHWGYWKLFEHMNLLTCVGGNLTLSFYNFSWQNFFFLDKTQKYHDVIIKEHYIGSIDFKQVCYWAMAIMRMMTFSFLLPQCHWESL